MKKALIVASVASMIEQFNMNNISILQELGYQVDVATNFLNPGTISKEVVNSLKDKLKSIDVTCIQVDFPRGLGTLKKNIKCYKIIKKLAENKYALVHCHSPIGGVLTRMAFKKSKTKVIYTAHGFHFYKGGPIKSWLIFYPIERFFARYTDVLITINNEDTEIAKRFKAKNVVKIPGVGIKNEKYKVNYSENEKKILKDKLNIKNDAFIMISIGELSERKNHIVGIKSLVELDTNAYYIICGSGKLKDYLMNEAKLLGVEDKVIFTGYVKDSEKYLAIADISLFLSKREGLGLAGLEAMAAGVPLISSYLGGIKDYTENSRTGFTIDDPTNNELVVKSLENWIKLNSEDKMKIEMNCQMIAAQYDESIVNGIMKNIYSKFI
ncbi:glycosyltransferase [Enterococcus dongliensis]|uniref:glycosyltransferase n=1 Tax=Enterococcus dongliensis TaxID=2559925 RepID=UPI00288E0584|nr:glycosyltransferase [Enterococcus dongliensis]MDT2634767.1 glycosyltransferase [Enterococcus dongliensis]MDT2669252.1 glycosyltransferase [Enterococcus dongliensis]